VGPWDERIPVEEYAKLADQFKPAQFDSNQWSGGGQGYMVMIARQHDGFSMFSEPGEGPHQQENCWPHAFSAA
jgi:alpha-L-fucosidase